MRLGLAVGDLNWERALSTIEPVHYQHWKILDDIEGIGWKREDRRFAKAMMWYLSGKGVGDIKEGDLLFELDRQLDKPTNESTNEALCQAFGGGLAPRRRIRK